MFNGNEYQQLKQLQGLLYERKHNNELIAERKAQIENAALKTKAGKDYQQAQKDLQDAENEYSVAKARSILILSIFLIIATTALFYVACFMISKLFIGPFSDYYVSMTQEEIMFEIYTWILCVAIFFGIIFFLISFVGSEKREGRNVALGIAWLCVAIISYIILIVEGFIYGQGWEGFLSPLLTVLVLLLFPFKLFFELISCGSCDYGLNQFDGTIFLLMGSMLALCVVTSLLLHLFFALKEKSDNTAHKKNPVINQRKAEVSQARLLYQNELRKQKNEVAKYEQATLEKNSILNQKIQNFTLLPKSDLNLQTVNNIIWCFEKRYASSITEAKQWLYKMRNDRQVQQKLQQLDNEIERNFREIQKAKYAAQRAESAAEAARKAAEAPVEVKIDISID